MKDLAENKVSTKLFNIVGPCYFKALTCYLLLSFIALHSCYLALSCKSRAAPQSHVILLSSAFSFSGIFSSVLLSLHSTSSKVVKNENINETIDYESRWTNVSLMNSRFWMEKLN
ncbi:hypothetical protein ACFFRR_009034 [Megaselia abdita]